MAEGDLTRGMADRPTLQDAAECRQEKLDRLAEVVALCECLWPLHRMRNGDGHDPACPAHKPLFSQEVTSG